MHKPLQHASLSERLKRHFEVAYATFKAVYATLRHILQIAQFPYESQPAI